MNKIKNGRLPFASKHIASNEYLLILFHYLMSMTFYQKHFVSSHGHTTFAICQNIGKE
jgi:hypothetical protein